MGGTFTQILVVLGVLQFALRADDQTAEVSEELLHQHEEQHSQEMAWLLEMEQRSQELPGITQGSLLLSACQHWWFWAFLEMLLVLFGFYWLPRQGSSSYDSSACGETPAEPRKKRRRRRKRMRGIADCCDKLDQIKPLDQRHEWKDMQNLEEDGMKGMINASAKPFPQKTSGQSCVQGIH
ncbi:uncharacterized protein ACIQIH_013015 isoform 1-T3 [Cyanocitta cristata]